MNESNSLIATKHGKYLKKPRKRKFTINVKKTFLKVKEKSKSPYCIALIVFIMIIFISIIIISFKSNKNKNKIINLKRKSFNNTIKNENKIVQSNQKLEQKNMNENKTLSFVSKFKKEYNISTNLNPKCQDLDPIKLFNNRLTAPFKTICKNDNSQHICYLNRNPMYAGPNGVICKMSNITLDPSKWNKGNYTYKGPVDNSRKGKPDLSSGFFSMKCDNNSLSLLQGYNVMYETYFSGWDYKCDNCSDSESYEELAPDKTIFFISRNQDSPNLYHGGSEFINALSLMYLLNLDPEDIQIIFLESMVINDDPFYDLYSNLIGRGGKPIYARDLNTKKKYHISNAVHIPINWDSPCFLRSGVPGCSKPTLTYDFYNKLIDNYMNITDYKDSFISDGEIFYYPKKILESYKENVTFTKIVTFQWRRVWPKGRNNQQRILGNGPELADKLAEVLPKNILVRLIDTASLPINEQISIMRKTDYFVGIHGAGLTLSIFSPSHCIYHEVLPRSNMNGLLLMASLSGHKTYQDIISSTKQIIDTNENFFFNVDIFANKVISHMKENHLIE